MAITAKYLDAEKKIALVTLEPGDHLASLNVQAPATIPAYTIPAHVVPAFELDGVTYPARAVPAENVPEQYIPGGKTTPFTVPCDLTNPVWVELLRRIEAGEAAPVADFVPPPPGPIVVNAIDFYRRLTTEEGAKVEAAMAAQPFVKRKVFETANTFRSDAPNGEWELLVSLAEGLFTKARVAELLAPSL